MKMKVLNLIILCLSVLVFASCVDTNSYSYWITDEKGNGVYQTIAFCGAERPLVR